MYSLGKSAILNAGLKKHTLPVKISHCPFQSLEWSCVCAFSLSCTLLYVKQLLGRSDHCCEITPLTVTVHLHFETFLETTGLTLVATRHIHRALIGFFAHVLEVAPNRTFEESATPVTAENAVMLAAGAVTTNQTKCFHLFCACRFIVWPGERRRL